VSITGLRSAPAALMFYLISAASTNHNRRVRVGMEATGHARWFGLAELGFELWIGDPAKIKAKRVRRQKTWAFLVPNPARSPRIRLLARVNGSLSRQTQPALAAAV